MNADDNETPIPDLRIALRLGTRGSQLALWQSNWVKNRLEELGVKVELVTIKTDGDQLAGPLAQIGGQGLFTKRIQQSLLNNDVDLAVHSLKDLPTADIPGLKIVAVPPRENCHDVLVSNRFSSLEELPAGSNIGTGSARRVAQLLHLRPDLKTSDIRGNVETRLKKLDDGNYDAIILAAAGLRRLGLGERITYEFKSDEIMPAVGQGALGLEIRDGDPTIENAIAKLSDPPSYFRAMAERSLLQTLKAGCMAPVGSFTRIENTRLNIEGVVLSRDGKQRVHATVDGDQASARELGKQLGNKLISQGADELLEQADELRQAEN